MQSGNHEYAVFDGEIRKKNVISTLSFYNAEGVAEKYIRLQQMKVNRTIYYNNNDFLQVEWCDNDNRFII